MKQSQIRLNVLNWWQKQGSISGQQRLKINMFNSSRHGKFSIFTENNTMKAHHKKDWIIL